MYWNIVNVKKKPVDKLTDAEYINVITYSLYVFGTGEEE